jgi:hypothetical protein
MVRSLLNFHLNLFPRMVDGWHGTALAYRAPRGLSCKVSSLSTPIYPKVFLDLSL